MPETMRKLKGLPLEKISGFLDKNGYTNVECKEYQLGKGEVNVDINSINSTFTGTVVGKKETFMNSNTNPMLDKDGISFDIKNGDSLEITLIKKRVDMVNGYTYLKNYIREDNVVNKIKAISDKEKNLLSFRIDCIESNGNTIYEELFFEKNGDIRVKIEAQGIDEINPDSINYKTELCFENGKFNAIEVPESLISLEHTHIGLGCMFKGLQDGSYGLTLNEKQQKNVDEKYDLFLSITPFNVKVFEDLGKDK